MDWREVIHQYLSSCVADSRRVPPPTRRAHAIKELGTTALKDRHLQNQIQASKRAASQQAPPCETYKVIEESQTRVIAEIEKADFIELCIATRFLVLKVDDQWKLEDIFWKCTCKSGICFYCEGTGSCPHCHGAGFTRAFFGLRKQGCGLCKANSKCTFCNGVGRCKHCLESEIPGWTSQSKNLRDVS